MENWTGMPQEGGGRCGRKKRAGKGDYRGEKGEVKAIGRHK